MPSRTIEIPSFDFASFYYAQILEALIARKRIDVPELTDESDFEPFIQLLRSFALTGHLNNVLLDVVANENTLPTAQLAETVRDMLSLIDYDLASAAPSTAELVYELSTVFSSSFAAVPVDAQAATRSEGAGAAIFFEALVGVTVSRTDKFTSVQSEDGGLFSDHTVEANGSLNFTPWLTPDTGDSLYFGHDTAMWTILDVVVLNAAINIIGIWEYYEGDLFDTPPSSVADLGGGVLEFDLTALLGTLDRRGTSVQVSLNETGATRTVLSTWNGSENIATTDLLGQSSPSTDINDYTVGGNWTEIALAGDLSFVDDTIGLTQSGEVSYLLPQATLHNWKKAAINGVESFWVRFRIITVNTPASPTLNLCRMDTGKQYTIADVTQGRSVSDDPLGSSNGTPSLVFETSRDNFIDTSEEVTVDDEVWTSVDNFLSSKPQDKHYSVELGENDRASIRFGDGVNGQIPPTGQSNISIDYRFQAEDDGNVGANTIVVDKTGLTFVNSIYNPRQAGGWAEAEGGSRESLERAKLAGPASLRNKGVALNGDGAVALARSFVASDGSSPFSRSTFVEEGFGPKTLELILVGAGGVVPTASQLAELELFFNGDKFANPPIEKHYVANNEVIGVSFTPRVIDVTAIVTAPEDITIAQIKNRLSEVLQPEALKPDGVTYEWNFGGRIPVSRISHEIFEVDESITDVDVSLPVADLTLGSRELPVAGTFSITVVQG